MAEAHLLPGAELSSPSCSELITCGRRLGICEVSRRLPAESFVIFYSPKCQLLHEPLLRISTPRFFDFSATRTQRRRSELGCCFLSVPAPFCFVSYRFGKAKQAAAPCCLLKPGLAHDTGHPPALRLPRPPNGTARSHLAAKGSFKIIPICSSQMNPTPKGNLGPKSSPKPLPERKGTAGSCPRAFPTGKSWGDLCPNL